MCSAASPRLPATAWALADGDGFDIHLSNAIDASGATIGDVVSKANALAQVSITVNDTIRILGTGAMGAMVNGLDVGVAGAKAVANGDGFEIAESGNVAAGNATIGTVASTAEAVADTAIRFVR